MRYPTTALVVVAAALAAPAEGAAQIDETLPADCVEEQRAALALVADGTETTTAVRDGAWSNPATWTNGVPATGARALIPPGRDVRYDAMSDETVASVRVDGILRFSTDRQTRLTVDTVVVTHLGRLEIGTANEPVRFAFPAEIVFADGGVTNHAGDLGLGLLAFGGVEIHGEARTAFHRLTASPEPGASAFTLEQAPVEWRPGERILFPATMPMNHGGIDEVVMLTEVDGSAINIDPPLEHARPSPNASLTPHVANLSRSVVFRSASEDIRYRGHIQLMHRRDQDVRYASFQGLGRSDRLRDYGPDNPVQRYPVYVHGGGPGNEFDDPMQLVGNVVEGSAGHGFVARDTHIAWDFNVAYRIAGGGFVIEAGNETGALRWNLAVHLEGRAGSDGGHPKAAAGTQNFAGAGVGFWFQSRLVYNQHNVAANLEGDGFVYFHRPGPLSRDVMQASLDHPLSAKYLDFVHIDKPAIQGFFANEAYGSDANGLHVIKNAPAQSHDDRSVLSRFVAWNTQNGVTWDYTGHYLMRDFALYAHGESRRRSWSSSGVALAQNIVDMTFENFHVEGYVNAFHVHHNSAQNKLKFNSVPGNLQAVDMRFVNNEHEYVLNEHDSQHLIVHGERPAQFQPRLVLRSESNLVLGEEAMGQPTITLLADREDALGRDAFFFGTPEDIESADLRNVFEMSATGLTQEGVYRSSDGARLALFGVLLTDRFTGVRVVHEVPIELTEGFRSDAPERGAVEVAMRGGVRTVNSRPYAAHDHATTHAGGVVELDVLANDTDVDGDVISVVRFGSPRHGTLEELGGGRVRYTPDADFDGLDAFDYRIVDEDGSGRAADGRARIDVIAVADATSSPVGPPGDGGQDGGVIDGDGGVGGADARVPDSGPGGLDGSMAHGGDTSEGGSSGCRAGGTGASEVLFSILGLLAFARRRGR